MIEHAKHKPKWLEQMLLRRPPNVVAVALALANKMARTAWAIVAHGRAYQRDWKSSGPGADCASGNRVDQATKRSGRRKVRELS